MVENSDSDQGDDPRAKLYKQQTDESFAALGRYIQEFELMVDSIRSQCTALMGGSVRAQIVFSHNAFTAQPLFDVFRALILNALANDKDLIQPQDQVLVKNLFNDLATYIQDSVKVRNDIVHGTWRIGWASVDQTDFQDIAVHKLKLVKDGYKIVKPVSSTSELKTQVEKTRHIHQLLAKLEVCVTWPMSTGTASAPASRNIFYDKPSKTWSVLLPIQTYQS